MKKEIQSMNTCKMLGSLQNLKKTKAFENQIKNFTNSKHCFSVNNGTISLTIAALALGVKRAMKL